jgi:hypothetical protein
MNKIVDYAVQTFSLFDSSKQVSMVEAFSLADLTES